MYVTIKSIERWFDMCMQESYYQERLKAFEKLQYEEQIRRYDEYFLIPPNDLEKTEMIGITNISDNENLIFCEEEDTKYLLYNNRDELYYINSSKDDSELLEQTFGTKEYELVI